MNQSFEYKKSLGQNFLVDKNVIHKIVDSACIDKDTFVIEIGPGSGAITKEIVPLSYYTLLYEADSRLKEKLEALLGQYTNYSLKIGDFLKVDIHEDLSKYQYNKLYVVANLPYYITTPIISKFIDSDILPDKMVLMVQKEVADRLSATVGNREYGSLTVFLNYFYSISKLFDVKANCFYPKPNVDSTVILFQLNNNRPYLKDITLFKRLVRDSFHLKRKNLRNNLKGYDLDCINKILNKYGYDLSVRAEQLSLDIFIEIANFLSS